MLKLSYSSSVRNRIILGTARSTRPGKIGICCCSCWMRSCTTLASSVWGLTTIRGMSRSSISSTRFPMLPSRSRIDSILCTLTRNIVGP